jgi:hypothetical protein
LVAGATSTGAGAGAGAFTAVLFAEETSGVVGATAGALAAGATTIVPFIHGCSTHVKAKVPGVENVTDAD